MKKLLLLMFLMPLFSLATYSACLPNEEECVKAQNPAFKDVVHVRLEFTDGNVLIMSYVMNYFYDYTKLHYQLKNPTVALFAPKYREGDIYADREHDVMYLFVQMFYELKDINRVIIL